VQQAAPFSITSSGQLHRAGNGNSKRGRGSEIDDQFELDRLVDWQVARLRTRDLLLWQRTHASLRARAN
jgi:hypothetical protein